MSKQSGLAMKCDRCGKEEFFKDLRLTGDSSDSVIKSGRWHKIFEDKDLCEECNKKFIKLKESFLSNDVMQSEPWPWVDDPNFIDIRVPLKECSYWNYEDHTCTHTCGCCEVITMDAAHRNRVDTIQYGMMVNGDRYCNLTNDGVLCKLAKAANGEKEE